MAGGGEGSVNLSQERKTGSGPSTPELRRRLVCSPGDKGVAAIPDFYLAKASRSLGSPNAPPRPLVPTEMVPRDRQWQ